MRMRTRLPRAVASGFGLGRIPVAPGTAASLAALAAAAPLGRALPFAALAATVAGTLALRRVPEAALDPGWVVIDEIAGQWIALLGAGTPRTLLRSLAACALFRLFDIAKPGPVGWADRRPGALGVMGDDVLAGMCAAAILRAGRRWL